MSAGAAKSDIASEDGRNASRFRYFQQPPKTVFIKWTELAGFVPPEAIAGQRADEKAVIGLPAEEIFEGISPRIRYGRLMELVPAGLLQISPEQYEEYLYIPGSCIARHYQLVTLREALPEEPKPPVEPKASVEMKPPAEPKPSVEMKAAKIEVKAEVKKEGAVKEPEAKKPEPKAEVKIAEVKPTEKPAEKPVVVEKPALAEKKEELPPQKSSMAKVALSALGLFRPKPAADAKAAVSLDAKSSKPATETPPAGKPGFDIKFEAKKSEGAKPVPISKEKELKKPHPAPIIDLPKFNRAISISVPPPPPKVEEPKPVASTGMEEKEKAHAVEKRPPERLPQKTVHRTPLTLPKPALPTFQALHPEQALDSQKKRGLFSRLPLFRKKTPIEAPAEPMTEPAPVIVKPPQTNLRRPLPAPFLKKSPILSAPPPPAAPTEPPVEVSPISAVTPPPPAAPEKKAVEKAPLPPERGAGLPLPANVAGKEKRALPPERNVVVPKREEKPSDRQAKDEIPNQEALQSIFMIEEPLTIARTLELCSSLPGIRACILARGAGVIAAANVPNGIDILALSTNAMAMLRQMQDSLQKMGIGSIPAVTLHSERGPVSVIPHEDLCFLVVHKDRVFIPGVRERLHDVLRQLCDANLPLAIEAAEEKKPGRAPF